VAERAPIHLRPSAPLAERVLLPGDPRRALLVAQAILEEPRMFNHARGLWGYTGRAADGEPLTVQATGMGGPSAAIVIEELIGLGAQTLLRIGTCGALTGDFALGELVVASRALGADGTSAALRVTDGVEADPGLSAALAGAGARTVTAVSTDLFYDDAHDEAAAGWVRDGARVVEMEAATLLAVAERRGVRAGVLLGVTDLLAGGRSRLDDEGVEALGLALGRAAWAALDGG
jgi:uridine phosphorylase